MINDFNIGLDQLTILKMDTFGFQTLLHKVECDINFAVGKVGWDAEVMQSMDLAIITGPVLRDGFTIDSMRQCCN